MSRWTIFIALCLTMASCQITPALPMEQSSTGNPGNFNLTHWNGHGVKLVNHKLDSQASLKLIDFERLADVIHITENGHGLDNGEQYGIHSVHYKDEAEARAICIRTCKHAWRDHKGDWMTFLAKRYCPVNWKVWEKNVCYFLNRDSSLLTTSVN